MLAGRQGQGNTRLLRVEVREHARQGRISPHVSKVLRRFVHEGSHLRSRSRAGVSTWTQGITSSTCTAVSQTSLQLLESLCVSAESFGAAEVSDLDLEALFNGSMEVAVSGTSHDLGYDLLCVPRQVGEA